MEGSTRESEFEILRETLLNQYHSENLTHSGFIIALIIGVFSIVANYKDFFNGGTFAILIFYFFLSAAFTLGCYVIGRLLYWIALSTSVLTISHNLFDQRKKEFEAPYKKDNKLLIEDERPNIAYMQVFGAMRIRGRIAKLSVGRLITYSLIVGIISYNLLLFFSLWLGIFQL
jgi:hypothetical protein